MKATLFFFFFKRPPAEKEKNSWPLNDGETRAAAESGERV